ncbi:MAG: hypothetical protein U1B83_08715 [Candidatus Cloacimonadaceae bacterium]|nr:hypothetical protein [Candidatus Cloacimonadaceae bacterium]
MGNELAIIEQYIRLKISCAYGIKIVLEGTATDIDDSVVKVNSGQRPFSGYVITKESVPKLAKFKSGDWGIGANVYPTPSEVIFRLILVKSDGHVRCSDGIDTAIDDDHL